MALAKWLISEQLIPMFRKEYINLIDDNGTKAGLIGNLASRLPAPLAPADPKLTLKKKASCTTFIDTLGKTEGLHSTIPLDGKALAELQIALLVIIRNEKNTSLALSTEYHTKVGTYDGLLSIAEKSVQDLTQFKEYDRMFANGPLASHEKDSYRNLFVRFLITQHFMVRIDQFFEEASWSWTDVLQQSKVKFHAEFRKAYVSVIQDTLQALKKLDGDQAFPNLQNNPEYIVAKIESFLYKLSKLEKQFSVVVEKDQAELLISTISLYLKKKPNVQIDNTSTGPKGQNGLSHGAAGEEKERAQEGQETKDGKEAKESKETKEGQQGGRLAQGAGPVQDAGAVQGTRVAQVAGPVQETKMAKDAKLVQNARTSGDAIAGGKDAKNAREPQVAQHGSSAKLPRLLPAFSAVSAASEKPKEGTPAPVVVSPAKQAVAAPSKASSLLEQAVSALPSMPSIFG